MSARDKHTYTQLYCARLSHIFKIPSISNKKLGISIRILGISNQKNWNTRFSTPWGWNTMYFEEVFWKRYEIPGFWWILSIASSIDVRSYLRMHRLLSKYCMPAQYHQRYRHSTPPFDYFSNQAGESGDVYTTYNTV